MEKFIGDFLRGTNIKVEQLYISDFDNIVYMKLRIFEDDNYNLNKENITKFIHYCFHIGKYSITSCDNKKEWEVLLEVKVLNTNRINKKNKDFIIPYTLLRGIKRWIIENSDEKNEWLSREIQSTISLLFNI